MLSPIDTIAAWPRIRARRGGAINRDEDHNGAVAQGGQSALVSSRGTGGRLRVQVPPASPLAINRQDEVRHAAELRPLQ